MMEFAVQLIEVSSISLEEEKTFQNKLCMCKGELKKVVEIIQERNLSDLVHDENMERNFLSFEENFEYYNILIQME